jgi:hypothetical protein
MDLNTVISDNTYQSALEFIEEIEIVLRDKDDSVLKIMLSFLNKLCIFYNLTLIKQYNKA